MTSSIVTRDVRFWAEAKFASMTEMRRRAALRVPADASPLWAESGPSAPPLGSAEADIRTGESILVS